MTYKLGRGYRVIGVVKDVSVVFALIEAGISPDYNYEYLKGCILNGRDVIITSAESGSTMPTWTVPLWRDLGVLDVRVERRELTEWEVVE